MHHDHCNIVILVSNQYVDAPPLSFVLRAAYETTTLFRLVEIVISQQETYCSLGDEWHPDSSGSEWRIDAVLVPIVVDAIDRVPN